MRCRKNVYNEKTNSYDLVFFGSKGLKNPTHLFVIFEEEEKPKSFKKNEYGIFTNEFPHTIGETENQKTINASFTEDTITINLKLSNSQSIDIENDILSFSEECDLEEGQSVILDEVEYIEKSLVLNLPDNFDFNVANGVFEFRSTEKTKIKIIAYKDGYYEGKVPYVEKTIALYANESCTMQLPKSADKISDGTRNENYSEKQQAVADSLIQKLSIIKKELWYQIDYGLPLLDKIKNKNVYDAVIIDIILKHPDIINITKFNSYVEKNTYYLDFTLMTIYNEEIRIQNTI